MYPGTHARTMPDKPAQIMAGTGETLTYRELDERSNQVAQFLRDRGLEAGDHISIFLENHPRYLEIAWGAERAGVYYTPINWHLTAAEAQYIVTNSQSQFLFTSPRFADLAAALGNKAPGLRSILLIGEDREGFERYEDVIGAYPTTPIADETLGAAMIYSSGTTGRPKGGKAPLPGLHPSEPLPTIGLLQVFGMDENTVYLSPGAPLYHGAPLVFSMATQRLGGTAVIMERFDPEEAIANIERYAITHSQWVPTMFVRMLRLDEETRQRYDLSTHQVAIHAAAPCPVKIKEQMIDWWGPIVLEYYGASEGGGMTFVTSEDWMAHKGTVGRSIFGTIHICDEEGEELPQGEIGTIYFEEGRPVEYHADPEKTANAYNKHGWCTVGDVGYLDEEGYLFLTDRKHHMIISGGVNIYPQEVEDILITHPRVADAAVIGVPNEEFGEEVKAVVELIEGERADDETAEELLAFCRDNLAHYKCPKSVDFTEELPRAASGKLYKRRLREQYWEGHGTRIV